MIQLEKMRRYSKPKKQVTAADIRRAIVQCSEAHALMINKSEYDRGFQCGLEHATRIIDQMLNDAWRAAVEDVRSKTYTVKLTRRRRK